MDKLNIIRAERRCVRTDVEDFRIAALRDHEVIELALGFRKSLSRLANVKGLFFSGQRT